METVKLARYRNIPYYVRCNVNGVPFKAEWVGSKPNGVVDVKEVPKFVADWLHMNTICFERGELVIVEESSASNEVKGNIVDTETYENNTHQREDILKLLQGNINKLKAELKKITVDSEKQFVIDVAFSVKEELTKGKIDVISEWMGISADILFD